MSAKNVEDRVRDLVNPILDDMGVELFDLEHNGGRLKITIDTDGGVDSGTLYLVTKAISRELDEQDPISSGYTLEVSTPGLERKLRRPVHWQKSIGEKVNIKVSPRMAETHAEVGKDRRFTGQIVSAGDTAASILTDAGTELEVPYEMVQKATTIFEWGPTPKKGGKNARQKKNAAAKQTKQTTQTNQENKAGAS